MEVLILGVYHEIFFFRIKWSKTRVRIIHGRALYTGKYGNRKSETKVPVRTKGGWEGKTLLWMNWSPKRTDWDRTLYDKKRSTCAWWACNNLNGTFVKSSKYIMLCYSRLCQRRRIHCNQTTSYCSLFFLVLWTSIYHYLVQMLIQMLNVEWQNNRDMIVASKLSISVLS